MPHGNAEEKKPIVMAGSSARVFEMLRSLTASRRNSELSGLSLLHLYMNSPFSYKGKFIEGYTVITVLLPDMISKRLVDLIIIEFQIKSSKITLNDKRAS